MTPTSHLRWNDTMTEAAASISQRPVRTLLTALGTILGVAAFVATRGLTDTAEAQVSSRFDALAATEVRVQDADPDGTDPFPNDAGARLEVLRGVRHAGELFVVPASELLQPRAQFTRAANTGAPIPVVAADPGAMSAADAVVSRGTPFDHFHQSHHLRVALLGRVAATQLGITRIDHHPVIFLGDTAYTVVGIVDEVRRVPELLLSIIVPTATAIAELPLSGVNYQVLIDTDPGAAQLIGHQAPLALRPDRPDALIALTPPDPRHLRNQVSSDLTSLFFALSGLALLIGAIAISNATLLSVIERRSEIGLRRALGATRRHIRRQITVEAALIGTTAGVAGSTLGVIGVVIAATANQWTTTINPTTLLVAPLIGCTSGTIAGLVPAVRASRQPPAEVLRT